MYAMIGTWKMCEKSLKEGLKLLENNKSAADGAVKAVHGVENCAEFTSVGFGGLPNKHGQVTLDAAFMDGKTLNFGGIMSAQNIKNPIDCARLLANRRCNCLLAAQGAEQFAIENGLPLQNMLTESSKEKWVEALHENIERDKAYEGHDTVCVLALDKENNMVSCTSTSGLFMKEQGRVGDSPIIGSGFYCDNLVGAAAATGVGEDIMRGCLSFSIVSHMKNGMPPQQACETALNDLIKREQGLKRDDKSISLIALNNKGEFGAATTLPIFPFVYGSQEGSSLYAARRLNEKIVISKETLEELKNEP